MGLNVVVTNRFASIIANLEIEVNKGMNGEFEVDDLIRTFENYFFARMILDITAIKDYRVIENIQKLSIKLDMSKVILLLDDITSNDKIYISKLISLGIYNFAPNKEGIIYLMQHQNSYKDVANLHTLETPLTVEVQKPMQMVNENVQSTPTNTKIIGFKNSNDHAGSTTLVYMLVKILEKNYQVVGIEVGKTDFRYFESNNLVSTTANEFNSQLSKYRNHEVVLVDLNTFSLEASCKEIIYLVEPSTLKLNRMMILDSETFNKLKGSKVVLNQSMLSNNDVREFEFESKSEIFFNIPPVDDKAKTNPILNQFLFKLGFDRVGGETKENENSVNAYFTKREI